MSYPRPDEMATESRIKASQNEDRMIKSGVKTLASAGLAAVGAGAASRIAPFLSGIIPTDLALKGISKVAPKVGDFLQKGMAQGLTIQSGLDFLKENMGEQKQPEAESKENKAPDQRNIIEQYSPSIFAYIGDLIKGGSSPVQAAQKAKKFLDAKAKSIITQMEQDHKTPFESIVESIFGGGQMAQTMPNQQMPQPQPQAQQPQGQNQQAHSGVDPQLASAMQSIRKAMQNMMNK